ncbi:hypothetical protein D9M71_695600 [compost metagenome]
MGLAGVGQVGERGEGAEFVVRRGGHQAASQQQRAGKVLQAGAFDSPQFEVPELLVERGVVREQRRAADEFIHFVHHLLRRRRGAQHGVADAGELFDEGRDAHAGIHQALVTLDDAPLFKDHHGNFRGPAAAARGDPGGFKVDDCDAFQTWFNSVKINS